MKKNKSYALKEIFEYYFTSERTFRRHLAKLKNEKKFVKTSIGHLLNEHDARELCRLLNINHPDFKTNVNN